MSETPISGNGVRGKTYVFFLSPVKLHRLYFFLLLFIVRFSAVYAQPDLENKVPPGYKAVKGTLSISDRHYQLGQQSLRWDWVSGDTLIIDLTSDEEDQVKSGFANSMLNFEAWVYNETAGKDTFDVAFFNKQGSDQFRFKFNVNYKGWRRLLRSYRNDMILGFPYFNDLWNIDKVFFIAPAKGNGSFFLDNLKYVRALESRESDYTMPDLYSKANSTYLLSDFHYRADSLSKLVSAPVPTATELSDLAIVQARILAKGSTDIPSAEDLQSANNEYATYNIQVTGDQIKGKPIEKPQQIAAFFRTLGKSAKNANNEDSKQKVINLLKLLIDGGLAEGSGRWFAGGGYGFDDRDFFKALIDVYTFVPSSLRSEIGRWLRWCTDINLGWETNYDGQFNTDNCYTLSEAYLCTILYNTDAAAAVKDAKCLKQFAEKFLTYQKGTTDGMKIDGAIFHHYGHYNAYAYTLGAFMQVTLEPFIGTSFQISTQAYYNLRKIAYNEYMSSNPRHFANSLCGRHPFLTSMYICIAPDHFISLAKIGGGILKTEYDPIVAGMYGRLKIPGDEDAFPNTGAEPFPEGFWQMNYSPAAIYRHDNWVATMRGPSNAFWGSEVYSNSNVYGRYQAYGALEIIYPQKIAQGLTESGMQRTGWDWNKAPGTTTIVYPFDSLRTPSNTLPTVYEKNNLEFAGGVKFGKPLQSVPSDVILEDFHGEYGIYGLNFQQIPTTVTHSSTFVFRKSFFCFGNKIVCLGSNINNDRTWRNTITTLFQGTLASPSTSVEVDGTSQIAFPFSQTLNKSSAHRLLDAYKTGYYIMPGSTIQVEKKNQVSKDQSGSGATSNADYANAYIDHGAAPVDGKYAYVVLPNTTPTALSDFATAMASPSTRVFDILQQDEHAHIVRENASGVTGYSLFTSNTNLTSNNVVKGNDVPCVAMLQVRDDTLRISVVNPDINLVNNESTAIPITIKLYGEWLKATNTAAKYASVVSTEANETTVMFSVADGLPAEITVVRISAVLPLTYLNLKGEADVASGRNVLTMDFENNDKADYALEYKPVTDVNWKVTDTKNIPGTEGKQSYVFYHDSPPSGENQYRIKCTDIDGTIKYSNIVQIRNFQANDVIIAPNPVNNTLTIMLKDQPARPLQWSLSDASGRTVKRGNITGVRESVNVRLLSPGVYYLKFVNGKYFPVVIQR